MLGYPAKVKFLANMGVSPRTVAFLRHLGHEAVRLSEVGLACARDVEVIFRATQQREVVVTGRGPHARENLARRKEEVLDFVRSALFRNPEATVR